MKKVLSLALFILSFCFSNRAFTQNVAVTGDCFIWINAKTGESAKAVVPLGAKINDADPKHAYGNGINWVLDSNGTWINAKTGESAKKFVPLGAKINDADPKHAYGNGINWVLVPCPPPIDTTKKNINTKTANKENTGSMNFPHKDIFVGFSLIREDNGSNGFYTYGGQLAYTRNLCWRGGLTGDVGVNFGSNMGVDYTKFNILAGGTYYPIKTAVPASDFSFSIHALAGVSNIKSSYGSSRYSNSYFTMDIGGGFNYYFGAKTGVGLRLSYMPAFGKGNTSNNFRMGLGLDFK